MLTSDLTVTDSGNAVKPGVAGALVFALVASAINGNTKRRVAATASSAPNELSISHQLTGAGISLRCRTLVRVDLTRNDVDVSLYGGKAPTVSAYLVIDRPLNQSAAISVAQVKNCIGQTIDAVCATGALDKLLNQES